MRNRLRYSRHRYIWALLVLPLTIASSHNLQAQNQKIGYVDTDMILSRVPEYRGIDQQLRLLSQEWKKELDAMEQEIERLKEEFEAREILYTEDVRKQKQEEIRQLVRQREQYMEQKFGSDGDYYQKQRELLEPIQRKVFDAINSVARRGGYDFVFDRAADTGLLFFRQEWNLNEEVLLEMGIDPDEASN
ncbi:MAG: OmpH family outer membrane protein [Balneolaceae bacterium]|nr:OmpH family outer membrane protein [Balneolaceae bacterium]